MSKKLELNEKNVLAAYRNASAEQKALLEDMFGKELFKSRDITERVKTFEDACAVLGDENQFVLLYNVFINEFSVTKHIQSDKDVLTYLKLRIITAALNEGWEPQFTEDECRYYPWFEFFTQSELNEMSDDKKGRMVGRASVNSHAYGGLAYACASSASSGSSGYGTRLAFKTRELAEYAGRQFAEIYAYFVFKSQDLDC